MLDDICRRLGVTFTLRNNRVWMLPAKAYRLLTDEERAFLRHNRPLIKQRIADGSLDDPWPTVAPAVEPAPAAAPAVEPAPKPRAVDPAILRVINANTPAEIERRAREATAVMMRMVGRVSPYL